MLCSTSRTRHRAVCRPAACVCSSSHSWRGARCTLIVPGATAGGVQQARCCSQWLRGAGQQPTGSRRGVHHRPRQVREEQERKVCQPEQHSAAHLPRHQGPGQPGRVHEGPHQRAHVPLRCRSNLLQGVPPAAVPPPAVHLRPLLVSDLSHITTALSPCFSSPLHALVHSQCPSSITDSPTRRTNAHIQ